MCVIELKVLRENISYLRDVKNMLVKDYQVVLEDVVKQSRGTHSFKVKWTSEWWVKGDFDEKVSKFIHIRILIFLFE